MIKICLNINLELYCLDCFFDIKINETKNMFHNLYTIINKKYQTYNNVIYLQDLDTFNYTKFVECIANQREQLQILIIA